MSYNPETNKWNYEYKPPYNPGYTYSHNRKMHQRKINKAMRLMNRSIENDPLWRGRFCVRSGYTRFQEYEDHSGCEMLCELFFIDKKTGKIVKDYETVNEWCFWGGSQLWRRMNDFIMNDCKVWDEIPSPREDKTDYRKM